MTLFCLSRLFLEHLAQVVEKGSCRPPAGSGTGPRRRKAGLQAGRPPSTAQHGASIALTAAGAARPPSTAQDGSSMAAAPAGTTPAGPQPRPAPPLGTRPAQRPPARQPRPRPLPAARTRSCAAVEKAREGAFRAAHTHPPPRFLSCLPSARGFFPSHTDPRGQPCLTAAAAGRAPSLGTGLRTKARGTCCVPAENPPGRSSLP